MRHQLQLLKIRNLPIKRPRPIHGSRNLLPPKPLSFRLYLLQQLFKLVLRITLVCAHRPQVSSEGGKGGGGLETAEESQDSQLQVNPRHQWEGQRRKREAQDQGKTEKAPTKIRAFLLGFLDRDAFSSTSLGGGSIPIPIHPVSSNPFSSPYPISTSIIS